MIIDMINPAAVKAGEKYLASLGTSGTSGPTFEEIMEQDFQKAEAAAKQKRMELGTNRENKIMELQAKMQEAVMKNEITMQQSRESNALDLEKHKITTRMQPAQPQQQRSNPAVQTAVNNQYHNNDAMQNVPTHLGNYV